MTLVLGSILLLGGALLCLLAAIGVLRLPDFFMRLHAATKAGVVGCGILLAGVGFAESTPGTWIKIVVAIVFLLLTTPVAGHLLGRAAYVSGAPFWRGTVTNELREVLPRGAFDEALLPGRDVQGSSAAWRGSAAARRADPTTSVRRVVLALARGPCMQTAIAEAIALARKHGSELHGLAIIDTQRLGNVGPVPIGGNWYAQRMRERRIAQARAAAAEVIEIFSAAAATSGVRWSVGLEEGRPRKILAALSGPGRVIAVASGAWFDQGVLEERADATARLRKLGSRALPVVLLGEQGAAKHRKNRLQ